MQPPSVEDRRLPLLLLASLALVAWAGAVWQSGGFVIDLPWGRLSSREPLRPLAAAILGALFLVWWRGSRGVADAAARTGPILERAAPFVAASAAALVAWLGVKYGVNVAGASDSYGYISQADLWLRGRLVEDFSAMGPLPWRHAEWTLSPLGYRPGPTPYTIVPTYPPGLPLLMALFHTVWGAAAKFWVVPVCAAGAVWTTYALGARLYDRFAGMLAACLLAASPAFLYQVMWPMSDVPATWFWTLALVSACGRAPLAPFASGLSAGIAVLIRPNLLPLALVPVLLIVSLRAHERWRCLLTSAGVFAGGILPAVAAVAVLNDYWYGSPFHSGYASLDRLYSSTHFWPNLQRYSRWLVETQTLFAILAVLPLATSRLGPRALLLRHPAVRAASALFLIVLCAVYAFYVVFDAWWYLRFLLPAYPLLLLLATAGLRDLLHRLHSAAAPFAILLTVPLMAWMVRVGGERGAFDMQQQERRHAVIAGDVAAAIPAEGVVLAMQHSGSLRYYGNRLTLRYDRLDPRDLDVAVDELVSRERQVYLLVEHWEEPLFISRYGRHSCRGALGWPPLREWNGLGGTRLYDLSSIPCPKNDRRRRNTR